jgi:tetratricopeptide (TPR) repeat protein
MNFIQKYLLKHQVFLALLSIVTVTIISYYPSLNNGFTNYDDHKLVTENKDITEISQKTITNYFTKQYVAHYHPLTMLSFAIEYHYFKLNPKAFHTTNLILHIINSLLVFVLFYLIGKNVFIAFFVSVLFAVHPMHVESVAWVTERKDLLYAFFYIGSLLCYIIYKKTLKKQYFVFTALLFICSLLSKTMAVTLPFLLLLFDHYLFGGIKRKDIIQKVPYIILTIIFIAIILIIEFGSATTGMRRASSVIENIFIGFHGVVFYIYKLFVPIHLSVLYPLPGSVLSETLYIISPVLVIFFGFLIYRYTTGMKHVQFGLIFFLLTILPVLQFIPFGSAFIAERYTYIPYCGLFYAISYGLFNSKTEIYRWLIVSVLIIAVPVFGIQTWSRCHVWKDSISLWENVLKQYPESATAYAGLGIAYKTDQNFEKALTCFKSAVKYNPDETDYYNELGVMYSINAQYTESINSFKQAIKLKPNNYNAYNNLGITYRKTGLNDSAILSYNKAISLNPTYSDAFSNMGYAFYQTGNITEAIRNYNSAIKTDPQNLKAYYNLGMLYMGIKQFDNAKIVFSIGLSYYPNQKVLTDAFAECEKLMGTK